MAMQSREATDELYQEGFADVANEEDTLAEEDYTEIDLGYCIEGQLLAFEEVDPDAADPVSFRYRWGAPEGAGVY